MNTDDKPNLELSLEPLQPTTGAPTSRGKAVFKIDTRGGGDRRKSEDRRQTIRFEQDRRQSARRGKSSDPWDQSIDF
ncbi:hypothetical protein D9M69_604900 [compost metagenome]